MNTGLRGISFKMGVTALLLITFTLSLLGGLSVVWVRQQITMSADAIKRYEMKLVELNRRHTFIEAKIAKMQSPEMMIKGTNGKLFPSKEKQVVWVKKPGNGQKKDLPKSLEVKVERPVVASIDQAINELIKEMGNVSAVVLK